MFALISLGRIAVVELRGTLPQDPEIEASRSSEIRKFIYYYLLQSNSRVSQQILLCRFFPLGFKRSKPACDCTVRAHAM